MGGYDKQRCCRREGGGGSQWVGMINRDVVEGRVVEEVSGWV